MAITADKIARVRRMTNEPTEAVYTNEIITGLAEEHKSSQSGFPGANVDVYDLHAIAADIWEEKAAALSPKVAAGSASAFGDTTDKFVDTAYEHALKQRDYHFAHRKPRSRRPVKWPREADVDVTL
jgi:hypothetical protein